jgi:hypothetical protein
MLKTFLIFVIAAVAISPSLVSVLLSRAQRHSRTMFNAGAARVGQDDTDWLTRTVERHVSDAVPLRRTIESLGGSVRSDLDLPYHRVRLLNLKLSLLAQGIGVGVVLGALLVLVVGL